MTPVGSHQVKTPHLIQSFHKISWVLKSDLDIPQNWKDTCCLQPSSAGCHAWRSGWACGSQGRSGRAGSRCPSWSTGPSHPGHHYHNGRHTPAAQTLSTHHGRFIISPWSLTSPHDSTLESHLVWNLLWRYLFCLQNFEGPALQPHLLKGTEQTIL